MRDKINATWDRVETMKRDLGLKTDVEFYALAGVDKGHGGQWKSGTVKTIGPEYAFKIQDKTGFQARWIMLGQGPKRLDPNLQKVIDAYPIIEDGVRQIWLSSAEAALKTAAANAA